MGAIVRQASYRRVITVQVIPILKLVTTVHFTLEILLLSDVDECKMDLCEQECENTVGSYKCSCLIGFNLNPMDNETCIS